MAKHAHNETADRILQEFSNLTNEQAYVHVFSQRMMKPVPGKQGEFFGVDQRIDMLPFLLKQVAKIPVNGQVFDVGAGAGDIVDFALKNASQGTTVNIEEPNPALIQTYKSKLQQYPHLKTGVVYEGPIQDYLKNRSTEYPKKPQNLILAIHMIYHLTDFTQPHIHPERDIIEAISFLYGLLAPGGSLFIVYADLLDSPEGDAVCGLAEKYYRHTYPRSCFADHLISIYKARNQLLGPKGKIIELLSYRFPNTRSVLKSEKRKTHFFGETVEDIAVLALATELCPSNSEKFDISKLQFCLDYVTRHPDRIGLVKETRNVPQRGMWRADEPQVIATITKQ